MSAMNMSACVSNGSPCGPEEGVGGAPANQRRPPLDELIARADRQAYAENDEEEPLAALQRRAPDENLASDDGGHKSLRKMSDADRSDFC
jgi:hypothetical protein